MRALVLAAILLSGFTASSQYYYKDIIGTKESTDIIKAYKKNKVSRVVLASFDGDNMRNEGFRVEQQFNEPAHTLRTLTSVDGSNALLISYTDDNGNVLRTVDSSNIVVSITTYTYNGAGQLTSIVNTSSDSAQFLHKSEQRFWQWVNGKPVKMLRIKNGTDTTIVNFALDEKGNVTEEAETHRGVKSPSIYYYYNDKNQLTDVVRFNPNVGLLLPEYMFEYGTAGDQPIQKITVPINNPDYTIWRYAYNTQGLKTKEAIYDKHKQLSGRVEYQYSYGQ